jgi:hypothetical protein
MVKVLKTAPAILELVPRRLANRRVVLDALPNCQWVADIRGALSVRVNADFLELCEL